MRKQVYSGNGIVRKGWEFCIGKTGRKMMAFLFLLTALAVSGCGNADESSTQPTDGVVKKENVESSSTQPTDDGTAKEEDAENEKVKNEDEKDSSTQPEKATAPYYGKWKIVSGISGQYSAMSKEEIEARTGMVFEYYEEYASYSTEKLDKPVYQETTISEAEFSELYQGSSFETLGISKDAVMSVTIGNALDMGSEFYVKDENTLITVWDGVFFELERVAD